MSRLLHLGKLVSNEDGSRNTAKMLLFGASCVAGVVGVSFVGYNVYKYVAKQSKEKSSQDIGGSGDAAQSLKSEPRTPLEAAMDLKENGNKMFKSKKFEEAKNYYTRAIETCPPDQEKTLAIFYQNRAAASDLLKQWLDVISDCDAAIARDDRYQKAYTRRGKAKFALERYDEALEDMACGYYLQDKKVPANQDFLEKALEAKAKKVAKDFMETRGPAAIGPECVRAYTNNFATDPILKNLEELSTPAEGQERSPFHEACSNFMAKKYNEVLSHLDEEIEQGDKSPHITHALLFRSTILTLAGCPARAELDLNRLLTNDNLEPRICSSAYLRRAGIYVGRMQIQPAMSDLTKAAEVDSMNSDVFHQRGQIGLITNDFQMCQDDTKRALELQKGSEVNPHLMFQQYMCDLQSAQARQDAQDLQTLVTKMRELCDKHPEDGECWCLYAQALIYFGQYAEAEGVYEKAVEKCKDNPRVYIQKAAMMVSWKKNIPKALEFLKMALKADPTCEAVYENLGIIYVQEGNSEEAIEAFENQKKFVRTELDCQNTIAMIEAIKCQQMMKERFGLTVGNVFNIVNAAGPGPDS